MTSDVNKPVRLEALMTEPRDLEETRSRIGPAGYDACPELAARTVDPDHFIEDGTGSLSCGPSTGSRPPSSSLAF